VIALTADAMPTEIERGLAAGFELYLTKPIRTDDLINAINQYASK
jgi:CheY-like chemotaxis protein